MDREREVTWLLARLRDGDVEAESRLFEMAFEELRALARVVCSDLRPGHTLQPTALVNEAWLKLAGRLAPVEDRRHFLVLAGRAMRQVLLDHARTRGRLKRGDGAPRVTLDTALSASSDPSVDMVDLNDALERLAERDERHARVAELRLFSGLTIEETAEALGVSRRVVDSEWAMAKAWLRLELA